MEVRGNEVDISIGAKAGCTACESGNGCGAGIFIRLWRRNSVLLTMENTLTACPGQSVIVGIPEQTFLRLVARLYVLPVLAVLAGAVMGHWLTLQISQPGTSNLIANDIGALVGAALLCAMAVWSQRHLPVPGDIAVKLVRVVTGCPGSNAEIESVNNRPELDQHSVTR